MIASFIYIYSLSLITFVQSILFGLQSGFIFFTFNFINLILLSHWPLLLKKMSSHLIIIIFLIGGIYSFFVGPLNPLLNRFNLAYFILNIIFSMFGFFYLLYYTNMLTTKQHNRLRELATIDPLTGLPNRISFQTTLTECIHQTSTGLGFMMIDTDNFKGINDTMGHIAGDDILIQIGRLFTDICQDNHFVTRYGGEEFIYMIQTNDIDELFFVAETIRKGVHELGKKVNYELTVSIGLVYQPAFREHPIDFLAEADKLLYEAKNNGKNKIVSMILEI